MDIVELIAPESLAANHSDHHFERYYRIHAEIGSGYVRQLRVGSGILVNISESVLFESVTVQEKLDSPVIAFTFVLAGESVSHQFESLLSARPGTANLLYIPQGGDDVEIKGNCPGKVVSILIDPARFREIVGELPIRLSLILESRQNSIIEQNVTSPHIQACLHQLIHCPFRGAARKLFLEAKTMELVALRLDLMLEFGRLARETSCLSKRDIESIYQAKELICRKMDDPPSLIELARAVGLNDFKLKKGFRELLGTTVYGYLREQRLNRAFLLLEKGELNITEIALAIGYLKPSNFAAAFKKRFGINPGALRTKRHHN